PVAGYVAMFRGALSNPFYIGQTLRMAAPLIVIGLGFAVANTAGFFNIGLSGQVLMGWFASIVVAQTLPDLQKFILLPLAIIAGMIAGAIWAGIAGVLRAYFDTSEVIVTIMLNHISYHTVNHIIRTYLVEVGDSTQRIGENASMRIPFLTSITNNSTLHMGIFVAIIMV